MIVRQFDPEKGFYQFALEAISTDLHAHPVAEVCRATEGSFAVEVNGKVHPNCVFMLVLPNVPHRLEGDACQLEMSLAEHKTTGIKALLAEYEVSLEGDCLLLEETMGQESLLQDLDDLLRSEAEDELDPRVAVCLARLKSGEVDYFNMVEDLHRHVNLSESRLSHLFKANLGISLQQYLLWNRLKSAIQLSLRNGTDLLGAALDCGFYDQAHFGRTFKKTMGTSPARVYGSRIVQGEAFENVDLGPQTQ